VVALLTQDYRIVLLAASVALGITVWIAWSLGAGITMSPGQPSGERAVQRRGNEDASPAWRSTETSNQSQ